MGERAAEVEGLQAQRVVAETPERYKLREEGPRILKSGQIVGSPPNARTVPQRKALVKEISDLLRSPFTLFDESKNWYEDSGAAIREITRGDPELTERVVRLMALYSQANGVGGNTTATIKSIYQLATGQSTAFAGRFPNVTAERIPAILAAQTMDDSIPGVDDKLMNFYRNLHDATYQTNTFDEASTIDRWMMRLFGYPHSEDQDVGGATGLSKTQYDYAKDIVRRIADVHFDRTGERLLPRQIQAALWTYVKNKTDYDSLSPEKQATFEPSIIDFSDYITRATANITWETRPSTSVDFLPGIHKAPRNQQESFNRAVRSIFEDENGNDLIFQLLGGEQLYSSQFSIGAYENQIAPNIVTRLVLRKDDKQYLTDAANKYASIIGYVTKQDAVPWYRADPTASGKLASVGYRVTPSVESVNADFEQRLFDHLNEVMPGIGFTRVNNSFDFVNFRGEDGKPFFLPDKKYKSDLQNALESFPEDIKFNVEPFRAESAYISNDWKENTNGEGYLSAFSPGELANIRDTLDGWRSNYDRVGGDYAKEFGWDKPRYSLRGTDTPQFREWFGRSKIVDAEGRPRVMYHGTARDITEFKPKQAGAIFVTDDPRFAEDFSYMSEMWMIDHADQFLSEQEIKKAIAAGVAKMAQGAPKQKQIQILTELMRFPLDRVVRDPDASEIRNEIAKRLPSRPNIIPVYVRAERPFDFENQEHLDDLRSMPGVAVHYQRIRRGEWSSIEEPEVQEAIQDLGFDGFYVKEGGKKNLAVYNSNQLKSVTGNIGTYRRDTPDIRYSLRVPKTPEFKQWSGNAPFVSPENSLSYDFKTGKPFVAGAYHGTNTESDFVAFDIEKGGLQTGAESAQLGIFSTSDPVIAENYASNLGMGRYLKLAMQGSPELKNDPTAVRLDKKISSLEKEYSSLLEGAENEARKNIERRMVETGMTFEAGSPFTKEMVVNSTLKSLDLDGIFDFAGPDYKARATKTTNDLDSARKELSSFIIDNEAAKIPQRILPLFIRMKNPMVYDAEGQTPADFPISDKIAEAKRKGHDGVVFKNIADPSPVAVHYVTFKPDSDIKSGVGNIGIYGQREPSEAEAAQFGMTREEAKAAQKKGDIRYSLRSKTPPPQNIQRFFDQAERLETTPDISDLRDAWIGGVSDSGLNEAAYYINDVPGGKDYTKNVQKLAKQMLGNRIKGFRLMSTEELENIRAGDLSYYAAFTLNPNTALSFANFVQNRKIAPKNLVVVEADINPGDIHMIGKDAESEVVVDMFKLGDQKVQEFAQPVRYSLRDFKLSELPKTNTDKTVYTLPAGTKIFHGSNADNSAEIKKAGHILLSTPSYKASGGVLYEGSLVWFGDEPQARAFSRSEVDRLGRAAREGKAPGTVFETVTDKPMKLISLDNFKVNEAQANKINDYFNMPEYKRFKAGDEVSRIATRLIEYSPAARKTKTYKIGNDTFYSYSKDIADILGFDGFYHPSGIAIPAETGIRLGLTEEGEFVGKPMERFSLRQQAGQTLGQSYLDTVQRTTTPRVEKGFKDRISEAMSATPFAKFRQMFINKYERIEYYSRELAKQFGDSLLLADQSAISAALMSDRAAGVAAESFKSGIPVYAKGYTYVDNMGGKVKGLMEIFMPLAQKQDPFVYQMFQDYAARRRGVRLDAQGKVTPFSRQELTQIPAIEKQFPEFKQVFDDYQRYNEGLVRYMRDTGVIDAKAAQEWMRYGDYIPFYRQLDGERTVGPSIFSAISGVKAPKKLKGGDAPLGEFLETVVRNSRAAIEAGMRNVASQRIVNNFQRLNSPTAGGKLVERTTEKERDFPDVVMVRENGKDAYYKVADPLLVQSMQALNIPQIPGLDILAKPAEFLREMVTRDPAFIGASVLRESLSAWITTGQKLTPVATGVNQFVKILSNASPTVQALRNAGIGSGYEFKGDVQATAGVFGDQLKRMAGEMTTAQKAVMPLRAMWDGLDKASTAADLSTRAAVFERVLEETGNEAEAIYQAMEVINFSRKGSSPIIQIFAAIIPFLNARIQGLDLLYRAGFGRLASATSVAQQKAFMLRSLALLGTTAMYYALAQDQEEWKNADQETRDNYWIIGGFKFPIPFELGVMFKVIPERIMAYTMGDDTGEQVRESIARQVMGTLSFNPIPQAVLPLIEASSNYSFFLQRDIVGMGKKGLAPEFQISEGTSQIAIQLGQTLGISPMKIDYIIRGYTGAMGTYAITTMDSIIRSEDDATKATWRLDQIPVLKRFMISELGAGTVNEYYDLRQKMDEVVRTSNQLERTGNIEALTEYLKENGQVLGMKDYIRDLDKDMKSLRESRLAINISRMEPDQKRQSLDALRKAEIALTQRINLLRKNMGV
jgi:hypothetical protein